jgi:hypothetical protein
MLYLGMDSPGHIIALSRQRLEEARILSHNGMADGAFYLAGYSVELMLKAKICVRLGIPNLFAEVGNETRFTGFKYLKEVVHTHNLYLLLVLSGLKMAFDDAKAKDKNLARANSLLFNCWDESARYKPCGHKDVKDVQKLLSLLGDKGGLLEWIENI